MPLHVVYISHIRNIAVSEITSKLKYSSYLFADSEEKTKSIQLKQITIIPELTIATTKHCYFVPFFTKIVFTCDDHAKGLVTLNLVAPLFLIGTLGIHP